MGGGIGKLLQIGIGLLENRIGLFKGAFMDLAFGDIARDFRTAYNGSFASRRGDTVIDRVSTLPSLVLRLVWL